MKKWEYQRVIREQQWSKLVANDIGHDAIETSYGSGLPRWKKCGASVNKFVANLDIALQKFNDEIKKKHCAKNYGTWNCEGTSTQAH